MKYFLTFEINNSIKKTKNNNTFQDFEDASLFGKDYAYNYYIKNREQIKAIIVSENHTIKAEHIFRVDGIYEYKYEDEEREIEYKEKNKKKELSRTAQIFLSAQKKDYQQYTVYAWEDVTFKKYGFHTSSLSEIEVGDFIAKLLKTEGAEKLKVFADDRYGSCSFVFGDCDPYLTFSVHWGLNKMVICHELAHYFTYLMKAVDSAHGATFVGVYVYLLSKYVGFDEKFLWKSLEVNKIDFIKFPVKNKILEINN